MYHEFYPEDALEETMQKNKSGKGYGFYHLTLLHHLELISLA